MEVLEVIFLNVEYSPEDLLVVSCTSSDCLQKFSGNSFWFGIFEEMMESDQNVNSEKLMSSLPKTANLKSLVLHLVHGGSIGFYLAYYKYPEAIKSISSKSCSETDVIIAGYLASGDLKSFQDSNYDSDIRVYLNFLIANTTPIFESKMEEMTNNLISTYNKWGKFDKAICSKPIYLALFDSNVEVFRFYEKKLKAKYQAYRKGLSAVSNPSLFNDLLHRGAITYKEVSQFGYIRCEKQARTFLDAIPPNNMLFFSELYRSVEDTPYTIIEVLINHPTYGMQSPLFDNNLLGKLLTKEGSRVLCSKYLKIDECLLTIITNVKRYERRDYITLLRSTTPTPEDKHTILQFLYKNCQDVNVYILFHENGHIPFPDVYQSAMDALSKAVAIPIVFWIVNLKTNTTLSPYYYDFICFCIENEYYSVFRNHYIPSILFLKELIEFSIPRNRKVTKYLLSTAHANNFLTKEEHNSYYRMYRPKNKL